MSFLAIGHLSNLTHSLGRHEENKFREAFNKAPTSKKPRSIHFTLKGGRKVSSHEDDPTSC